jgi:hypothetical protein
VQSIVCFNIACPKIIILCDRSATFKSQNHISMIPVRKLLNLTLNHVWKLFSVSEINTEANVPLSGKGTGSTHQFTTIKSTSTYIKIWHYLLITRQTVQCELHTLKTDAVDCSKISRTHLWGHMVSKPSKSWLNAGHGSQAVYGMNCLRSHRHRDCGFESHSGHGCLVFVVCVCFSVFVYRYKPCDKLITLPRSPTDCPRSSNWSERNVSWRQPRPELDCRAKGKKKVYK